MKDPDNPMRHANAAPRCTARSKRTGEPCRAAAVKGWTVCRMHGAGGGAPSGPRNGAWKHGGCTNEALAMRKSVNQLRKLVTATLEEIEG